MNRLTLGIVAITVACTDAPTLRADSPPNEAALAKKIGALDARVIAPDSVRDQPLASMLQRDLDARMRTASLRENNAWQQVKTRADWEKFRDQRIASLQRSLGEFPPAPKEIRVRVSGKVEGDGYRIQNLVFESRPGLIVTANLYLPANPPKAMPGILIAHSQHNPKTQTELQDMGMTWARQGCLVLVPDVLGHGERRQHPFVDAASYPGSFRVGRQDYYFRYNAALQLHAIGESLAGWMVWDLMRSVDVLLAQPGVDKDRIILLGSVAGGGDPAALAAALDPRIAAVAPFNFGGPQPDYAIPENAERDFYWFGVPTWESTRCLRNGARDGFAHWVIVSAVAPRGLLYSHEFGWEEKGDPAWPRMQKVFALYGNADHLAVAAGRGNLKGRPPEHTHCNNIGVVHRGKMYPAFKNWFGMPIPEKEFQQPRDSKELTCLTPDLAKEFRPRSVHELAAEWGERQTAAFRQRMDKMKPEERRQELRRDWARLLGDVEPRLKAKPMQLRQEKLGDVVVERLALEVEPGIIVPMILLQPPAKPDARLPIVVALAQEGKEAFLKQRSEALAEILDAGVAVCLPDLRGTGETQIGGPRQWRTSATAISQAELMLGQTLLGSRLRDLRSVLQYLRTRTGLDADRIGLWGDSFASANPADDKLQVPLDADRLPSQADPVGGLLALFGALFDDQVRGVYVQGGMSSFQSLLGSAFVYVPHDCVVPGALTAGDVSDVAAALAPRPLCFEGLVDGLNRRVSADALAKSYEPARAAYRSVKAEQRLRLNGERPKGESAVRWLADRLKGD